MERQHGDNSGVVPDVILDSYWFHQTPGTNTVTIYGLNVAKTYQIIAVPSRTAADARNTLYRIGATEITVNGQNNTSLSASFTNVSPNGNGEILLELEAVNQFAYLNALIVTEEFTGPSGQVPNILSITAAGQATGSPSGLSIRKNF